MLFSSMSSWTDQVAGTNVPVSSPPYGQKLIMWFSTVINPPAPPRHRCCFLPTQTPFLYFCYVFCFVLFFWGFFVISDLIALARISHSEPSYSHISNGWSCHGVLLLPVTTTVNMGAQCLEATRFVHVLLYLNISRNPWPFPPLVPPLSPSHLCPFFRRR